jgi:hypothetical protein
MCRSHEIGSSLDIMDKRREFTHMADTRGLVDFAAYEARPPEAVK